MASPVLSRTSSTASTQILSEDEKKADPKFVLPINSISHIFKRSYPPVSAFDTQIVDPITRKPKSCHGETNVFQNNEIKTVHEVVQKEFLAHRREFSYEKPLPKTPVYIEYTSSLKPIIQQQATRGCTAAAVAMLLKEHKKEIDFSLLRMTNLGNTGRMSRWISNAGLTPVVTHIKSLHSLSTLLRKDGPAIISLSGDFGGHVVVLDHLGKEFARLRDPYHGWEITVYRNALEKYFVKDDVIQINRPKTTR